MRALVCATGLVIGLCACDTGQPKVETPPPTKSITELKQSSQSELSPEELEEERRKAGFKDPDELAAENIEQMKKGEREYVKTRLEEHREMLTSLRGLVDRVEKEAPKWAKAKDPQGAFDKFSEKYKEDTAALDETYKFEAPSKLVEAEFRNIWHTVSADLERAGKTFADEDTTEEEAREEYQKLAERRVRLGLVLSQIGETAGVSVGEEEIQRAVYEQIRQFPGQEQQIYDYFRNNPEAINAIRAPLFEEKVVDHLLTQISVTDQPVSKEELLADDEDEGDKAAKKAPAKKKAAPKKKKADEAE